ncbi:MAG: ABC transporter ATP-binding protein [Deltaproteobacteria bacterium]|nr:ABC transporter ATP-binding protein [Deltaproteobacteria bacterium]
MAARADRLVKRFGGFAAVDGVSFEIADGAIFGFLGANGAGKTTTIRMMCGLLAPTAGTLSVAGVDVAADPEAVRRRIGYMSQLFSLYPELPVEENLRFFGGIYGLRGAGLDARISEVLHDLDMAGLRDRPAGSLPLGFKQRLALASAALHRPEIIFLDEPTSGVDPISRMKFWRYITRLAKHEGMTVVVSTHFLHEAEYCDYILLMNAGRVVAEGTPAGLRTGIGVRIFETGPAPPGALPAVRRVACVRDAYAWGRAMRLAVDEGTDAAALGRDLRAAGVDAGGISEVPPSLEDVFIRHYKQ